jgi:hypothetical protein
VRERPAKAGRFAFLEIVDTAGGSHQRSFLLLTTEAAVS